jgi:hypothetical protein
MTPRIRTSFFVAALSACSLAASTGAHAQDAISLFKQGRALVEANCWAEACPLFAEAHRIDPNALGILLNLADCNKRIGKTASAWSAFQEAEFLAKKAQDRDREQYAHDGAASLEPTLSRLRIDVKDTPGLMIRRNDQEVGKGVWGMPFPVDPGPHKIEATAPGYSVWSTTITVGAARDLQTIEIPGLVKAPEGSLPGSPAPGLRAAAFVVGGTGAAALLVGGVFGGLAASAASSLKSRCQGDVCATPADQSSLSSADTKALVSTVGLSVGAGLLATGVVLFVVSRPSARLVPSVGPQGASLTLMGSF